MNTKKNVVDVSPFLLFKSSADTETHRKRARDGDDDECYKDYGDDAESTSQRTIGSTGFDSVKMDEEEEIVAGEKEDHDDEDGVVNSYRRWPEGRERENLTVDSCSTRNDEKLMKEIEKNRMFWEACLAS